MLQMITRILQGVRWKRARSRSFAADFARYKALPNAASRFTVNWEDRYPCLDDNLSTTDFNPHYVYHPAWAARKLALEKPQEHVDISSMLNFATMLSAFIPVRFYDYRPARLNLDGLTSEPNDLCKLSFASDSIRSLSCMHVVEHVGLGRYGDPLDVDGDLKACRELARFWHRADYCCSWSQWVDQGSASTHTAFTRTNRRYQCLTG